MTAASKGLHRALARAGSSSIAIAEMQTADLLAEMTDDQKTALAAQLAPKASADEKPGAAPKAKAAAGPEDEDDDDGGDDDKPKAKAKAPAPKASASDPRLKAVAEAVATDDACKGKADLAISLLADDDYKSVSASGIIKMLGSTTVASAGDPEEAARAEMRAAISGTTNSKIEANDQGGKPDAKAKADSVWDRAYASVDALRQK